MIFWNIFQESIKLPSKKALFKLNRTGMDLSVIYMFILTFISSLPSLIEQFSNGLEANIQISTFFLIIYFFIFHYLPITTIVMIGISFISFIALGITKVMKRKLRFSILWKMTAYTTTIPFLIFTILAFFFPLSNYFLFLSILYTLILLIKMISIYPQRRR